MAGAKTAILLILLAAILAGTTSWRKWVLAKERQHSLEVLARMSEEETKRLRVFIGALNQAEKSEQTAADPSELLQSREIKHPEEAPR